MQRRGGQIVRFVWQARVKTGTIRAMSFQSSDGTNMWDQSPPAGLRYKYLLLLVCSGASSSPTAEPSSPLAPARTQSALRLGSLLLAWRRVPAPTPTLASSYSSMSILRSSERHRWSELTQLMGRLSSTVKAPLQGWSWSWSWAGLFLHWWSSRSW